MSSLALRELTFWLTHYRHTWRSTVVVSFGNPALFLVVVGFGIGAIVDRSASPALHGLPYLTFLAPGMLAAATMQVGVIDSGRPVYSALHRRRSYRAAVSTPLRPVDVFHGHLLFMTVRLIVTAGAFTVVMAILGLVRPIWMPALAGAAVLTGLAFAVPQAAWAVTVTRPAVLNTFFRFVAVPLYMLSGTFFPTEQLPGSLRGLVSLSPLWHGVELCRTLNLGTATVAGTLGHGAVLLALAATGLLVGNHTYRRHLHR
jgi:lipooligosaccharide transport system permease protein